MKRLIVSIFVFVYCLSSFALTENEGIMYVKKYYGLLNQYATAENITLAKKIEGMHVGKGYVYPDVEIKLGKLTETEGVGIKTEYLASIMSRQNLLLKFVPKSISLESNYNGISTMAYTLYVYSGNEQAGQDVFKYSVPLKIEIQNSDKKIRSILKGTKTPQRYTLSVTPSSLSFNASGGTRTITVNSNTKWEISVNTASWGHLTRTGNTLTLRVDANTSSSSRTDYFKIKAGDKEERIDISQEVEVVSYTLSVSQSSFSFGASGGTQTITVNSNTDWSISVPTASWGHLTRSGNTLTLRVDANTSTSSRTDYFIIKAGDKEKKISISQDRKDNEAIVHSTWITHNLTRSMWNGYMWVNVPYMRIHCHFEVNGHKGENIRVCAYFYFANGNRVNAVNPEFRTSDGQATVQGNGHCDYEGTEWKDYSLDIPYYALPKGNLTVQIQIQDKNGGFLANSSHTSFTVY